MIEVISDAAVMALRRLMELRERRDVAKAALTNAEKDYRDAEADVYESLTESKAKGSVKVDLGEPWGTVSFGPRETYRARIIDQNAAQEYYEQRAMIDEISAPKFVMARLNEEVRDCREQGRELPPGLDWYAQRGVTITRQKN